MLNMSYFLSHLTKGFNYCSLQHWIYTVIHFIGTELFNAKHWAVYCSTLLNTFILDKPDKLAVTLIVQPN